MVLYFLQQRQPPVIPVLQEVTTFRQQPKYYKRKHEPQVLALKNKIKTNKCVLFRFSMEKLLLSGWSMAGMPSSSMTWRIWWASKVLDLIWFLDLHTFKDWLMLKYPNYLFCCCLVTMQRRRLSELQPNRESVGELWLGLLRFYTEEFDFKEHVISIRQRKRLTTFEKQWTSKCIAIEGADTCVLVDFAQLLLPDATFFTPIFFPDPFDLNHNLGAGVSRKSKNYSLDGYCFCATLSVCSFLSLTLPVFPPLVTNFIMKAFINGRKLFGTPFYPVPGTEVVRYSWL